MVEPRERILEQLIAVKGQYLSGQEMRNGLGVTRTAIWKEIKKLRLQGYEIISTTNKGYCLKEKPYFISSLLVQSHIKGKIKNRVVHLDCVDSTNLVANRMVLDGAENGTVIIAEEQTKGAGRMGKSFDSQKGKGIYLSMVIEPKCEVDKLSLITSYAGLATCYALEELGGLQPSIKWPNDIIFENKKAVGILTRLVTDGESNLITHGIIGIGINILQDDFPEELGEKAISLKQLTGKEFLRGEIAGRLISHLNTIFLVEDWLNHPPEKALDEIKKRSCTIGKEVEIIGQKGTKKGTAYDISSSGGLMVDFGETKEEVSFGEVSVRGLLGYV